MIPIVISVPETVFKDLIKGVEVFEIGGREEIIKTTAFLRSDGILRRVLETWGDLLCLKLQWETTR